MDRLAYWLYRAVGWFVALLPLPRVFALGAFLGRLGWWLAGPYRRLALHNLEIAFGREKTAEERRRMARDHFVLLGANLLCGLRMARMSREEILRVVTLDFHPAAQAVIDSRRGYVCVLAHAANWELLAQLAPLVWAPPNGTVYQRLGNPYIDAEVRASRARLGLELFERKDGFQGAIRLLRAGGALGVLVDQHSGDAGVWVPFFGRLASTSSLAPMLALRTGVALLPQAVLSDGPGRWIFRIEPPIPMDGERDVEELTARMNVALERLIRFRPESWFWVHNRWKTPNPKFLLATYKRSVRETPPEQKFRLVLRGSNWLGDAVMSISAVQAIKRGRPDLHLALLTPAKLAELWQEVPEVDEVIAIEPGEGVRAVAAKLRRRFDAAVLFPNSLRAALEVWWAGVPRRVGYAGHSRRWLLNQVWRPKKRKREKAAPPEHQVNRYLRLAEFIGAEIAREPPPVASRRPRGASLRIGLCPGAEYGPAKRWLPERFRAVMDEFRPQPEWVVVGVEKDRPIADAILQGYDGPVRNCVGQTSLAGLIHLLRECDALLTNDTGTMHLAAWLGVPVVAVFGSTEPLLTGPLGESHQVLRDHVECSPCFLRECPLDFRCMHAVTTEQVLAALRTVTAGLAPAALVESTPA